MKTFAKIIISILFIVFFLMLTLSVTFKFQLLNPNFWKKTFDASGTYTQLSEVIKNNLENQIVIGGGRKSDAKVITDLVTPQNLKDFIDNNINNTLGFVNGKNREIIVYIPIDKIPKSLLPLNFNIVKSKTSLQDFLKEFNIEGITSQQISQIRSVGVWTDSVLFLSAVILLAIIFALYKLTEKGKRFTTIGVTFIIEGFLIYLVSKIILYLVDNLFLVSTKPDLATKVFGIVGLPVFDEISSVWRALALVLIIVGVLILFFKKHYNKQNKAV